jgi:RNA polymerase sigma factor (sigma-70 family)
MPVNPTADEDDETLNLRIQCQDRDAIATLLELYGPKAKGYLRKQYRFCDADVEAALFQAAECAWKYGASYNPTRSLKSWFMRIIQRQALNIISDKKGRREVGFSLDHHDQPEDCGEPIDKKTAQQVEDLERCIEKLEGNQQAIIREDLASDGIADAARLARMLGSSTNSIYASRNKAKANLKRCVDNEILRRSKGAKR